MFHHSINIAIKYPKFWHWERLLVITETQTWKTLEDKEGQYHCPRVSAMELSPYSYFLTER